MFSSSLVWYLKKKRHDIFAHMTVTVFQRFKDQTPNWGLCESCLFPMSFSSHCWSFLLSYSLNWKETWHLKAVRAGQWVIPFQQWNETWNFNPEDLRIQRVADSLSFTLISGICTMPGDTGSFYFNWHKIWPTAMILNRFEPPNEIMHMVVNNMLIRSEQTFNTFLSISWA